MKWNGWNVRGNRFIRPQNWSLLFGIRGYAIHRNNHTMKILSFLLLLIVLNGCTSIKKCAVQPTIAIDKSKEKTTTESNTDSKTTPSAIIQDIRENATPGGQVKCTF